MDNMEISEKTCQSKRNMNFFWLMSKIKDSQCYSDSRRLWDKKVST